MSSLHGNRRIRVLATIVLGVMVFASFLWLTGPHMGHQGICIPASLIGSTCPNAGTSSALSFHTGVLRQFTEIVLTGQPFLLIVLFALAAFGLFLAAGRQPTPSSVSFVNHFSREHWRTPRQLRFSHWLALHESSPTVIT